MLYVLSCLNCLEASQFGKTRQATESCTWYIANQGISPDTRSEQDMRLAGGT